MSAERTAVLWRRCRELWALALDFDAVATPTRDHDELSEVARLPAAMAVSYGETAARLARADLWGAALALSDEVPHQPTRLRVLADLGRLMATQNEPLSTTPLVELLRRAQRAPSVRPLLPPKASCLITLARAVAGIAGDLPEAVSLARLTHQAVTVAARARQPDLFAALLGPAFATLGPQQAFVALVEASAQAFTDGLKLLDLAVQRDLPGLIVARARRAAVTADLDPAARLPAVETAAAAWFDAAVIEPFVRERVEIEGLISRWAMSTVATPLAAAEAELWRGLESGEAHSAALLPAEQADDPRARGGRPLHLERVEYLMLRDVISARARRLSTSPAMAPAVVQQALEELLATRAERVERVRTSVEDLRREVQNAPERPPRLAPGIEWSLYLPTTGAAQLSAAGWEPAALDEILFASGDSEAERLLAAASLPRRVGSTAAESWRHIVAEGMRERAASTLGVAAAERLGQACAVPDLRLATLLTVDSDGPLPDGAPWQERLTAAGPALSRGDRQMTAVALARVQAGPSAHRAVRILDRLGPERLGAAVEAIFAAPELGRAVLANLARAARMEINGGSPGGGTFTNFADVLALLCSAGWDAEASAREAARQRELAAVSVEPTSTGLPDLRRLTLWGQRGRTLIFAHPERSTLIAAKLLKVGEPRLNLEIECRQQRHKAEIGAASLIPRALGIVDGLELPPDPIERCAATDLEIHPDRVALLYETDDPGLFDYANEVETAARTRGMQAGARDLFTWLRAGEVDTALTVKNHNAAAEEGVRGYEWMIDLFCLPSERRGMGRLDRVDRVCTYPNVRATGLADLAELAPLGSQIARAELGRDNGWALLEPLANLTWFEPRLAAILHRARLAGDYLLDLSLLIGDAERRAGRLSGPTEALAAELLALWTVCFASYTGRPPELCRAALSAWFDFPRLARQLRYFLTPASYFADFDRTVERVETRRGRRTIEKGRRRPAEAATLERFLSEEIYGGQTRVHVDLAATLRSWIPRPEKPGGVYGFSSDGRHHDLGIYNGPWLLLELERALHLGAGLLLALAPRRR